MPMIHLVKNNLSHMRKEIDFVQKKPCITQIREFKTAQIMNTACVSESMNNDTAENGDGDQPDKGSLQRDT